MTTPVRQSGSLDDAGHDFDGEPARELPPDEPKTPGYIPAIGLALLVVALVIVLVRTRDSEAAGAVSAAATTATAIATAPVRPAVAPAPERTPPASDATGAPKRNFSEAELKVLQERAQEARKRMAGQGKAPAPAKKP